MAEVGLLPFAKTALEVMEEVSSDNSSKFSKHTFTQPQLLTILCPILRGGSGSNVASSRRVASSSI
jgi:hypothetical protein